MPATSSSSAGAAGAGAGVATGSRTMRPPTASSSSSSNNSSQRSNGIGGTRPPSSTSSAASTGTRPTTAAKTPTLSSKRSIASSASSRPTAPKVQVRQQSTTPATTSRTGVASAANQAQQQRGLRTKASTSSLSTTRDDTTMKRITRPGPSATAGPSKTPASSTSSRQPVRGNLIFHQLKADVLRGDASAFFPQVADPELDKEALLARLVRLCEDYLHPDCLDVCSASFYSLLALSIAPESVPARRLRARCFLEAGQGSVFPFVPGQGSKRAGALAALATLEDGSNAIFSDVESAKIWSQACIALDRRQEAEEVLKWSLASSSASTSLLAPTTRSEEPPELVSTQARRQAVSLCDLGFMAKESGKTDEAERHFVEARSQDPWNWRAWVGLCQLGAAPLPFSAFADATAEHDAVNFLDQAIVALGGTPSALEPSMPATSPIESAAESSSQASSSSRPAIQRPGTRPTTNWTTASATAKRTKSVSSPRTTAASKTNGESSSQRSQAAASATPAMPGSTVMSRTLSQAKTNERPSSSLSNSSALPEKEKQSTTDSMTVTRDSLRRSTRAQAGGPQPPSVTRRTAAAASRGATGAARVGASSSARTAATTSSSLNGSAMRSATTKATTSGAAQRGSSEPDNFPARPTSSTLQQRRPQSKPASTSAMAAPSAPSSGEPIVDDVAQSIRQATLKKAAEQAARWRVADQGVLKYLRILGSAYKDALDYKGDRVLRTFSSPPSETGITKEAMDSLLDTAEVGCLIARVHHDMAQYPEAEHCFDAVLRGSGGGAGGAQARRRLVDGMDIYSLVLYHLNRQHKLSALAQDLLAQDPEAVETHLTIGNLFSLNASPAIALRSFRRACLSRPGYAYSYTLAGHECLSLNQPLKALRYFRQAVRLDKRHWNGWSGIGTILSTEGKWSDARFALSQACSLNSSNAGLHEVLAVVHEMLGDRAAALEGYDRAMALNPKGASAALRKAELLWASGRLEMAHEALLRAVALAPNEARAHLLLAESFMRKGGGSFAPLSKTKSSSATEGGDGAAVGGSATTIAKAVGEAVAPRKYHDEIARHLAIALDLDPSLSRRIKAMTEGVGATLRGQSGGAAAAVAARAAAAAAAAAASAAKDGISAPPPSAIPGGHLGPAMGLPDRSIDSSFSGVDSRLYDEQQSGQAGDYSSFNHAAGEASEYLEDSMGVLRDEQEGMSFAYAQQRADAGESGDVEEEEEEEEESDDDDEEEDEDDDEEGEGEDGDEDQDGHMSEEESARDISGGGEREGEAQDSSMAQDDVVMAVQREAGDSVAAASASGDVSAATGDGEEEMSLE